MARTSTPPGWRPRASVAKSPEAREAPPWGLARPGGGAVAAWSLASDPNADYRDYMEDGHRAVDPWLQQGGCTWAFFGVYDGHGGKSEMEYCEARLHDVVLGEVEQALGPGGGGDVGPALAGAFRKIDSQLAMLGAWGSGCTATVALLRRAPAGDATLHVANVGDSRAVLVELRAGGGARRVSTDHHAGDPDECKRIQEEGGFVRYGRVAGQLIVSRSLGDHHLKSAGVSCIPSVHTARVGADDAAGHALVIASDGLWDALSDEDAGDVVRSCAAAAGAQGGGPEMVVAALQETSARSLVDLAKDRGSRDNILVVVVFF